MEKKLDGCALVILLLSVLYFGGHFIVATANGWDGVDLSTDSDISIDTGTRETITDTIIIEPGYDVPVTDSDNNTVEMEVTTIDPVTEGPIQMEVYDYDTGSYLDLSLDTQ
jgi:hypothetical protein